jgi:hypothetical protein
VLTPTDKGGLPPPPVQPSRPAAPAPAPTDVWRMAAAGVAPLKPKKK